MIGKRFGNWVVEHELGRGGMGRVYLAHRISEQTLASNDPQMQAAVKVLAAELAQDAGFLHRFQREIEALSQLDHPNIVRFYESGEQDGLHYYAMEYVRGRNFDEILQERGRLAWKEVLDMALQVCPALKHAHDHGVIHRDLKTQNILRTEDGVVKLADFGVAKVFASRQLTATGGLVGTAEYLSPEQAAGKPVTVRSDLYSFGVVLYVLLTGRMPFQGESILDLLHKHRFGQYERPRRLVSDLPLEIDEVVCMLLEKDPAARPANALMLQRQLESAQRKLERKQQRTVAAAQEDATRADNIIEPTDSDDDSGVGIGHATLVSRLVREELEREKEGGPLAQLFRQPVVLVTCFLLCGAFLVWRFWPGPSAEQFMEQARPLLDSSDPADWQRALERYVEPMERLHPRHPYDDAVRDLRRKLRDWRTLREALGQAREALQAGEAERGYRRGLKLCQEGDTAAARDAWCDVVRRFANSPDERRWVDLAQRGIEGIDDLSSR